METFPEKNRTDWPFKNMKVGEVVKIKNPELVNRGQTYVHIFGKQSNQKFKTRKVGGELFVQRLV